MKISSEFQCRTLSLRNMASSMVFLELCVLFFLILGGASERTKDKMYEPIDGAAACFRRLNGTHQFGCTSHRSGNVGVIQVIENLGDLEWLINKAKASPYMAVVLPEMFNWYVMSKLQSSGKVNGVLLVNSNNSSRPDNFTHEDKCPNRYSGLATEVTTCNSSHPWNPDGTGLMFVDWGFPIFQVSDADTIEKIHKCYLKFNADTKDEQQHRSLCALEMNSYMLAAVNSQTCIRRSNLITNFNRVRFCDPLGDHNIWATLFPRYESEKNNRSIFVVAARLDGTSMFDGLVPGAVSPVSGIVTLLMTAKMLAAKFGVDAETKYQNVLFLLLNGEAYDYIGSSRLVWDMNNNAFPVKIDPAVAKQPPLLRLEDIKLFIELGQISMAGRNLETNVTNIYIHTHKSTRNDIKFNFEIGPFIDQMQNFGSQKGLKFIRRDGMLPPASLQSFLAADKAIHGFVLADHDEQFANRYYHSIMDDSRNLGYKYSNESSFDHNSIQELVARLSSTLAETLYFTITNTSALIPPDPVLANKLFHCFLDTMDCGIFRAASYKQNLAQKPASLYVGVNGWIRQITTLTGQTLAWLMNRTVNYTEKECHSDPQNQVLQYIWMSGDPKDSDTSGLCFETTMNYSLAISPAFFEIPDYNWSSGHYSTWTESIWKEFSVRMFLKPSRSHEKLTFSLGVMVFLVSFVVVCLANSRSEILFGNRFVTSSC